MAAGPILDFTHFIKRLKLMKVHPADSEVDILGYKNQSSTNYTCIYKISRFGRKILFGREEVFFIL